MALGIGRGAWGAGGAASGIDMIFPLWGIPFVLVGLYAVFGRFLHDAWIRSRTRYGLTDGRALILVGDRLTAVDLKRVATVQLKGGPQRGTIVFGSDPDHYGGYGGLRGFGVWLPSSTSGASRFSGIDSAQAVFNQVEQARAA
jgi:hypothetical protein